MARLIVGLTVLVAATGFAPVPRPKPERKLDMKTLAKKLQGTWEIVSTERNMAGAAGRMTSRGSTVKFRFEGDRWTYVYPNNVRVAGGIPLGGELKLDTSKGGLATMDLIRAPLPGQAEPTAMMRGIVKFEGDTIKFCYSLSSERERPTSFEKFGVNQILMTLRRAAE